MKKQIIKVSTIVLALSATNVLADETYMCTKANQERVISVVYEDQVTKLPCKVNYQKEGQTKTLWSAKNKAGYCEKKAESFVQKQKGWGWNCAYVSDKVELGIQASPAKQ